MDNKFTIKTIASMQQPATITYIAMHQDYCDELAVLTKIPNEQICGELVVKHLLSANRGHFGCLEHPQIVFNVGYFPHSTMQQLRTHRVGVSFDVQSFRYTGVKIAKVAEGLVNVEDVFYLRSVGFYTNRQGARYYYCEQQRQSDLQAILRACRSYAMVTKKGMPEEQARSLIPFDVRQHFVLSCNARSLMHLLDLRWKKDAQLECQQFCNLLFDQFLEWYPAVANWYSANRAKKAKLSP
jgi:thymidylate synthase (FAD)